MSDAGGTIRRSILIGAAVFSVLTAVICAILGGGGLMARAYDVERIPVPVSLAYLAYSIFLAAFAWGLFREREWAWYAGFVAAGISVVLAIPSIFRHEWGIMAFDLAYGGLLAGTLLWSRRAGSEPA